MRSILEKALIALLNEEREKADALFHDFILERSRQIHESLRQGEDFVLDESWENDLRADVMFTEDELAGDDAGSEEGDDINEADDGEEVDADAEADADDAAADDASADSALDSGVDAEEDSEEDDESLEDRVDDLEDELVRLAAEFDALVAGEDSVVDGVRGDLEGEEFGEVGMDSAVGGSEDVFGGADEEENDFAESLGESVTSELEKVKVDMAGKELGGKQFSQNNKSPLLQPKLNDRALKGEPVEVKADEHVGFDKEASPKVDDQKLVKARNTKSKATDGRTKVSKEGDKSAELNDPMLSKGADKSVIGSTTTPMGKNL
jgi:hypothetical protein